MRTIPLFLERLDGGFCRSDVLCYPRQRPPFIQLRNGDCFFLSVNINDTAFSLTDNRTVMTLTNKSQLFPELHLTRKGCRAAIGENISPSNNFFILWWSCSSDFDNFFTKGFSPQIAPTYLLASKPVQHFRRYSQILIFFNKYIVKVLTELSQPKAYSRHFGPQ